MFDLWKEINERGPAAIPADSAVLSPLAWVELGETHPDRMPEKYHGYDIQTDPQLIRISPFVEKDNSYLFCAVDSANGHSLEVGLDIYWFIKHFNHEYFHSDSGMSEHEDILVCSGCGIAGCDGIWSQTCHVSQSMVHWTIRRHEDVFDLFFDRDVYETGAMDMLRSLTTYPNKYSMPYGSIYEENHGFFVSIVGELLSNL